jgi:prepilin-type processing-associated H-X9-DG protein
MDRSSPNPADSQLTPERGLESKTPRASWERSAQAGPAGPRLPLQAPTSGKSIAALVLGLSSLLGGLFVTGLPAVAVGLLGLWDVRRGRARKGREGLAVTGIAAGLLSSLLVTPLAAIYLHLLASEAQSADNLRGIGASIQRCNGATGALPPLAICGAGRLPMLSWRVALLPYTGDPADKVLYNQFRLDESWDGPHNILLLSQMPKRYALPGDSSTPRGYTYYRVFYDNGAAFDRAQVMRLPTDFPSGAANTILVVEAAAAVPWTKPEDFPFSSNTPLPPLGRFPGGFHVLMADGSVRWVSSKVSVQTLRNAIDRGDNDVLGSNW